MMDKQKKESPSAAQSARKPPGFKIPKKSPDGWCEDIPTSSPLTRLNDLKNVTLRKRECRSSYEAYNSSRNKDSHQYYTICGRDPKIILKDILRSGQGTQAAYKTFSGSLASNDGKCQINPVSSSSYVHPPASESVCVSRAPRDVREQPREREMGMKNEVQSQVHCKEQTRESWSNKCDISNTCVSSRRDSKLGPRKSSNLNQESQDALKAQEQKNCSMGIEVSPARRDKTYCHKYAEHQNKKLSLSPSSTDLSSSSSEPFTDHTICTLDSPARKNITRVKITDTANQHKSSDDGCSSDPPKPSLPSGAYSRTRRKTVPAANDSIKIQPIVLSSDEEEAAQKETKSGFAHTVKKMPVEKKCLSPTKDTELMEDATTEPEESNSPVLELKFLNVYFGKMRGRVPELAKFTATSIEIPIKVPLHNISSLSVETRKLKKYGFWITKGGDSVRSSAVIILWMASDYVPVIEQQFELSARKQTSKADEFIFMELVEPLKVEEQSLIKEIMLEASKHGSSSLAEVLTWDEMCSMLESLPPEECAFKLNCYNSGSKPPEAKKVKSNFSLTQKWSDNGYSFSMVPEQHTIPSEAQRSGVPIRLLVYPPPPTKGGLGVSNEDLQCLEHGEFLNDVIIDFYLKYLLLEIFPKPFAERCHIFSSFFFKCLTRKENNSNDNNQDVSTAERRHQRVKNWTRHVDILRKDFIFVPVNENSHWYLAVICFPWLEKAVYEDKKEQDVVPSQTKGSSNSCSVIVLNDRLSKTEEASEEGTSGSEGSCSSGPSLKKKYPKPKESHIGKVCKRPCILIFDSLRTGSVRTTVQVLREYLQVECQVKQKSQREFSRSSMREFYPKVPKQNNSTDCGLYLLQYVETFSQKPMENFEPPMHLENWFPSCVVKNKREEIRDLILKLHVEQKRKS